jgi:hypothetical protein
MSVPFCGASSNDRCLLQLTSLQKKVWHADWEVRRPSEWAPLWHLVERLLGETSIPAQKAEEPEVKLGDAVEADFRLRIQGARTKLSWGAGGGLGRRWCMDWSADAVFLAW